MKLSDLKFKINASIIKFLHIELPLNRTWHEPFDREWASKRDLKVLIAPLFVMNESVVVESYFLKSVHSIHNDGYLIEKDHDNE